MGSHVAKALLDAGFNVRATVRGVGRRARFEFLNRVARGASELNGRLEFVEADLVRDEGWDDAVRGVVGVVHTAMTSFKPTAVGGNGGDPAATYLEPALRGMERILRASNKAGTVRRVVFTSSITAVSEKFEGWESRVFSSADWNETASLKHGAYAFAKTAAEKRMFEFIESPTENTSGMTCASVLPFAVMGPSLTRSVGEVDRGAVLKLLNGEVPALPPLVVGVSDVRDVATAHVRALQTMDAAGHRFIVTSELCTVRQFVDFLRADFPEYAHRFPRVVVGKGIVSFAAHAFMNKDLSDYLDANMGIKPVLRSPEVHDVLGMVLRPARVTVRDVASFVIAEGFVKPLPPKSSWVAQVMDAWGGLCCF